MPVPVVKHQDVVEWWRWLRRRSQRGLSWDAMARLLQPYPLLTPGLLGCIERNSDRDRDRFLRAIEQYRQATKFWRQGWETYAVMHLWMAVEAITKTALRRAIEYETVRDEDELVERWGLNSTGSRAIDRETRPLQCALARVHSASHREKSVFARAESVFTGVPSDFATERSVFARQRRHFAGLRDEGLARRSSSVVD